MKKLFLFAALAFSLNGFAQKVSGKIGFQKGQKLEVVTEAKTNSTQEVMGQSMESTSNTTFTEIYDVQNASASGATIEHKVKHFKMSGEAMGKTQDFDSEKGEDMNSDIGKMIDKKILKNKYTMTVDAYGKITAVKLDDDNAEARKKDEEDGGMAEMMAQQLGATVGAPKVGDASVFSILPAAREVGIGDTWSDTTGVEGVHNKKMYTVKSITATDVVVDFTMEQKIEKTMQVMGNDATINTTNNGTGTITFDRKTGLVRTITSTNKTEGSVDVQGMSIPLTSNATTTITVKPS